MPVQNPLRTQRLLLRDWKSSDYLPFSEMNADPRVMRFFPNVLSHQESDALADRLSTGLRQEGIGFWAMELAETGQFIGTVGIKFVQDDLPCAPFYEIGWRIAFPYWRKGFAFEAANKALDFGFKVGNLPQIFAVTSKNNFPSWHLMEKLGMERLDQTFQHPEVPKNHPYSWHYLYRIKNPYHNS